MAPDKSFAAEIEAVTERERTRLVAWLERYALSSGNRIDREIMTDALMTDFIAPLIAETETLRSDVSSLQNDCADEVAARRAEFDRHAAEIAALQSRAFEDGARPKVLATGWLKSMGRRDDEERGPVVEFVIDASQQHAMTFGDIWNGKPHQIAALPLQPEGERNA